MPQAKAAPCRSWADAKSVSREQDAHTRCTLHVARCGAFRPVGVAIKDAETRVGARHFWLGLALSTRPLKCGRQQAALVCVYLWEWGRGWLRSCVDVAAAVDADAATAAAAAAADVDNCRMR